MTPPMEDQWYYLEGSATRGPVPSTQIAQMIKAGTLSASTQVAQAGWPQWSPASAALAHLLGAAAGPSPVRPLDMPVYAIKVHCVAGPDVGKAYMIGAAEVSIGRVSGIGQNDPAVAENHVVLSWQNNVLNFRTLGGMKLRVAGTDVIQGTLSNGQQFQIGASTWQVGNAPVEMTNLLGSLASRLNKLTSTEKLEGFSLTGMFSEVFKGRKPGEIEDYFVVGTTKTTPPLDEVQTGWPKPWFFMRVLLFMLGVYFILAKGHDIFGNILQIPGIMMIGSLAVPLGTAMLFWELNTPRNVSFVQVLTLICLGGVISLFFADIAYEISNLGFLGAPSAGIVEEVSKLAAVVIVVRNTKYKYILNGMVFGAAIGAGFAVFETAGYSFREGYLTGVAANAIDHVDLIAKVGKAIAQNHDYSLVRQLASELGGKLAVQLTFQQIDMRSFLAPFGHVVWTAIAAGALWRVKGADPLRLNMFFDPTFVRMFLVPVVLHMLWDTDLIQNRSFLVQHGLLLGLGVIGYWFALLLVQQGLRQIKDAQVTHAKTEYTQTQEILTTTGRFRAGGR